MGQIAQKITPFLWFDHEAEDAANLYVSLFEDSSILQTTRYGKTGPSTEGTVMTISFQLAGQRFTALNGGPHFQFTEAVSFVVSCADQGEVDHFWCGLSEGGKESQCGWLKDKFGVSWQIIPAALGQLLGGEPESSQRALKAMLQMKKLDIAALEAAYRGESK